MPYKAKRCGFTLIEVIVALIIISISLFAVSKAFNSNVRYSIAIKETIISNWLAMNKLAELQAGIQIPPSPSGKLQGNEKIAGLNIKWIISSKEKNKFYQDALIDTYIGKDKTSSLYSFLWTRSDDK